MNMVEVSKYTKNISTLFNWEIKQGYIKDNVFQGKLEPTRKEKMMAVCATTVDASKRWIGNGSLEMLLENPKDHPRINQECIAKFVTGTTMNKIHSPPHYTQGYDAAGVSNEPIQHGLALRLFIPFDNAEIIDMQIDVTLHMNPPKKAIILRRNPETIVQFNVSSKQVRDFHIATCLYRSATKRRYDFRPGDWEPDTNLK